MSIKSFNLIVSLCCFCIVVGTSVFIFFKEKKRRRLLEEEAQRRRRQAFIAGLSNISGLSNIYSHNIQTWGAGGGGSGGNEMGYVPVHLHGPGGFGVISRLVDGREQQTSLSHPFASTSFDGQIPPRRNEEFENQFENGPMYYGVSGYERAHGVSGWSGFAGPAGIRGNDHSLDPALAATFASEMRAVVAFAEFMVQKKLEVLGVLRIVRAELATNAVPNWRRFELEAKEQEATAQLTLINEIGKLDILAPRQTHEWRIQSLDDITEEGESSDEQT